MGGFTPLTAHRFAMSSVLPAIAYVTRMDVFVVAAGALNA